MLTRALEELTVYDVVHAVDPLRRIREMSAQTPVVMPNACAPSISGWTVPWR